jgi:hypothetical protein
MVNEPWQWRRYILSQKKTAPGRKAKASTLLENKSVSFAGISQARTVLRYLPEISSVPLRIHFPRLVPRGFGRSNNLEDLTLSLPWRLVAR